MDRKFVLAQVKDRTINIDVRKHLPVATEYTLDNFATALQKTRDVKPNSVWIVTLHAR